MSLNHAKEQAHALIDRMSPGQIAAVVGLLEIMLDPLARSLANAPYEDEAIGDDEIATVAASKAWLENNTSTSHDEILAEFGISSEAASL